MGIELKIIIHSEEQMYLWWSVAISCLVESLPSNLMDRVRFPEGSGILISVLGLGFCPVLSPGGGLANMLTTHSGRPALVLSV